MEMRNIFILLGVIVVGFIVFKLMSGEKNMSDKTTIKKKIEEGALIIDVRTPGEFKSGAYKGAINIPVDQIESRVAELGDKNRDIIVYCQSGGRSSQAKRILESKGFTNVHNGGGIGSMP